MKNGFRFFSFLSYPNSFRSTLLVILIMIPLHGNPVRVPVRVKTRQLTTIRSTPAVRKLHDSVLLRGRENSQPGPPLTRTEEEERTPFLVSSLTRKEQVDSEDHLLRAAAQTRRHTCQPTAAQQRLRALLRGCFSHPRPRPNLEMRTFNFRE